MIPVHPKDYKRVKRILEEIETGKKEEQVPWWTKLAKTKRR